MPTLTPTVAAGALGAASAAATPNLPGWLRLAAVGLLVWLVYRWLTR
jgi:hypothetical protein